MPYRSAKQRAFLHATQPALAASWDAETGGKVVPKKKPRRGLAVVLKPKPKAAR